MTDQPAPAVWKNVVAGGLAGASEIAIMYPTDVLKTRAQLSQTKLTLTSTFKQVLTNQGVGGFYRGIWSPIFAEAPKRAWKFTANEKFKQLLADANGNLTLPKSSLAGALSGMSEALINCPFETVKVRMQSPEFLGKITSTGQCLSYLVRNEGFFSIYKGLEAQMWRNGVWNGAYFGILGWHSQYQKDSGTTPTTKKEQLFQKFYVGAFASCVGTILNTPFDVIKSRMQNQSVSSDGKLKYRNTLQSLLLIQAEEGSRALYKGLAARLLRLGPGGGIMIVAFDFIISKLNNF